MIKMASIEFLENKRKNLIEELKKLHQMLVEGPHLSPQVHKFNSFGCDIQKTIKNISENRRLIILCLIDRCEVDLRRVTHDIWAIREE